MKLSSLGTHGGSGSRTPVVPSLQMLWSLTQNGAGHSALRVRGCGTCRDKSPNCNTECLACGKALSSDGDCYHCSYDYFIPGGWY